MCASPSYTSMYEVIYFLYPVLLNTAVRKFDDPKGRCQIEELIVKFPVSCEYGFV